MCIHSFVCYIYHTLARMQATWDKLFEKGSLPPVDSWPTNEFKLHDVDLDWMHKCSFEHLLSETWRII